MAVVYFHKRKDTNEVFYVGIGKSIKRAYSKYSRTDFWHNIVNKVGYHIEIIHKGLTWDEACEYEKKYIKEFGRKDLRLGSLVNLTDGGEGQLGFKHSEETKRKMSKISSILLKGHKVNEETKIKIGEANKGNQNRLGAVLSEETKIKISKSNMGKKAHNKGVAMKEEQKKKISKTRKKLKLNVGEKNGRAILTKEIVIKIRNEYQKGDITYKKLALKYNISRQNIHSIIKRITWKNI